MSEIEELREQNATLALWHREDEAALTEMRNTIVRLRSEGVPATRIATLREAAAECDKAAGLYAAKGQNDHASAMFALMERFLREANEVEYRTTPCSVASCDPGGEPCTTHERLMAHAEGDHELCAPGGCGPVRTTESADPEAETETVDQALNRRLDAAIEDVFERWETGLNGQRPQDAIREAVLAALSAPVRTPIS